MAQLDLAIVGGEVVNADGVARADVGIAAGRIAAVVAPGTPLDATRTIDAAGQHLLPGVIDPHVHMRSPGLTFEESLERETRSLISGGVTSALVFLQAPTGPYAPVLTEAIAAVPERSYCDLGFSPIIESMDHVRENFPGFVAAHFFLECRNQRLDDGRLDAPLFQYSHRGLRGGSLLRSLAM